jgi:hypothetical protein
LTAHWRSPLALFWLSSYVASHCLAVAPHSGAKQNFYCSIYYITLNSNCEAQRAYKNLKKIVEDRVRCQKKCTSDLSVIFLLFKGEKYI